MPNQARAIIDPFAPMEVSQALMVAVSGVVVVFMMLACLALVIVLISKVVGMIEGRQSPAPAPVKGSVSAAPAPKPAAPAVDEGELVAVMMAAIAEDSGMSPNSFRITQVTAAPAAAPAAPVAPTPAAAAPAPVASSPVAPAPTAAPAATGGTPVNSPMPGNIFKVECKAGQSVKAGDVLIVLEAMKMEIEVSAPVDGTVQSVEVAVGAAVNTDDLLVMMG